MNVCKNICLRYKSYHIVGQPRYKNGEKFCSLCSIFLTYNGKKCPCCGLNLRTKTRTSKPKSLKLEITNRSCLSELEKDVLLQRCN